MATDRTVSSLSKCQPYRSPWGAFPTRGFGISTGVSSAAIYEGEPVTLDFALGANTSNAAYIQASSAVAFFYLAGIAAQTISGSSAVTHTVIPVHECNPLVEFKAATKNGTLDSSYIGLCKTLSWDSTLNIAYVDLVDSTAANYRVVVTDLVDGEGDSGGYVAFRFLTDARYQGSTVPSSSPFLAFYR